LWFAASCAAAEMMRIGVDGDCSYYLFFFRFYFFSLFISEKDVDVTTSKPVGKTCTYTGYTYTARMVLELIIGPVWFKAD